MQDSDAFMQLTTVMKAKTRWGMILMRLYLPNGYPTFPVLRQMSISLGKTDYNRLTDDYLMNPEWNTNLQLSFYWWCYGFSVLYQFQKAYIPYGKIQIGKKTLVLLL